MSQWEKPDRSLCKEFKETLTKNTIKQSPPRIKTLTRATKKDVEQVRMKIKQQLPVLTSIGIRRYRLPHYECVLLELKENGMSGVAEYMEMLFQIDENSNNERSLKFHRNLVDRLKNILINAEQVKQQDKHLEETTILFDTAVFFQSISSQWFWIVRELLQRALSSAALIDDDGFILNAIKFFYGQFLLYHIGDFEKALIYLSEVRNTSTGKYWNASNILKIKQDNLYKECNILLFEIYHAKAKKLRIIDPKVAVKMSFEALKCANDAENNKYISEALYEFGKSLMIAEDVASALKIFAKFLAKVKKMLDYRSICNAHKELAIAHQRLNDDDGIQKHLHSFRECANEHELPDKLAEAHYLTGEYLLGRGLSSDSSLHLRKAFDMYKSLAMVDEIDKSRYLLAISKGEEVLEEYMKLVLNCGIKDKNETLKLLAWKNTRVPFWSSNFGGEISNESGEECSNSGETSKLFTSSLSSV